MSALLDDIDLDRLSASFETAAASDVIRWAVDTFGDGLVVLASMQDAVLVSLATSIAPDLEVVFLDTQYHFPETLAYAGTVQQRLNVRLTVRRPNLPLDDLWKVDTDACCAARKVKPLDDALAGRTAWMTGLRRADSAARASTPILQRDKRGLVKIAPIATWSDLDVAGYSADRDLPVHPLTSQGYPSIGCWPCTQPVAEGDDSRAGRWAGSAKTECGLHL